MPPSSAHLNGSVSLADAETVMREVAVRIRAGVRRIPDGETGDRNNCPHCEILDGSRT